MKDFMNNPMMDMFKKSFENPMAGFGQNFDMFKNNDMSKMFNPATWAEMGNKMMEHMPWLNAMNNGKDMSHPENAFNFAENIKGMDLFSDLSHLSLENTQAMLRRQGEIIQKHSAEVYKFIQNMSLSNDHEANMKAQADFTRSSFESLVSDFKELSEMYSKANLETFEAASNKVSQQMGTSYKSTSSCSTKEMGSCSETQKAKKTSPKKAKKK